MLYLYDDWYIIKIEQAVAVTIWFPGSVPGLFFFNFVLSYLFWNFIARLQTTRPNHTRAQSA